MSSERETPHTPSEWLAPEAGGETPHTPSEWLAREAGGETPHGIQAIAVETHELLTFAKRAALPEGGFGYLTTTGAIDPDVPLGTLINARMTYCMSIAEIINTAEVGAAARLRKAGAGLAGAKELAAAGIHTLRTQLADQTNGGYVVDLGDAPESREKKAYLTAFVVLAAATARRVAVPGADELLDEVLRLVEERFWSEAEQALIEGYTPDFGAAEAYWGANANMHGVEAFLAAHGATGDDRWLTRAAGIARRFIDGFARSNGWMLAEHYDQTFTPQPSYNRDRADDQFRPYGVTIGHLYEWARLLLELRSAQHDAGQEPEPWLDEAAVALYDTATRLGWQVDGAEGFVYTVDWDGTPVVRERLHWVVCEALAAAATLAAHTGEERFRNDARVWRAFADRHLIDRVQGSWHHTLDAANQPTDSVWSGKPDVYHALQAVLMTAVPVRSSLAERLLAE